jgi:energy-coupling factor transport system permease protein
VRLVPSYRRRDSPLHAARASVAFAYCAAFALADALFWRNPVVTAALILAVLAAARGAGVAGRVLAAGRASLWFAALAIIINAFAWSGGTTVLARLGTVFGHRFDITLEAIVWGAVTALSVICLFLVFGLYTACVDPDELLRLVRRVSRRSALTASLATRLVPVLARDAEGLAEAARCRPTPPGRLAVTRAALARSLERAVDIAAALEVRGYASARPPARIRRAWSGHDLRFAATALALTALALAGRLAGVGRVVSDPTLRLAFGAPEIALVAVVLAAGIAPFIGPRARLGVARA